MDYDGFMFFIQESLSKHKQYTGDSLALDGDVQYLAVIFAIVLSPLFLLPTYNHHR